MSGQAEIVPAEAVLVASGWLARVPALFWVFRGESGSRPTQTYLWRPRQSRPYFINARAMSQIISGSLCS